MGVGVRAQSGRHSSPAREYRDGQGAATAASAKCECGARSTHITRSAEQKKIKLKLRNLRQTRVLERVIWRSRIFVQPPTDTGSSIYIRMESLFGERHARMNSISNANCMNPCELELYIN
jgi:hypothetical protein